MRIMPHFQTKYLHHVHRHSCNLQGVVFNSAVKFLKYELSCAVIGCALHVIEKMKFFFLVDLIQFNSIRVQMLTAFSSLKKNII